MSKTAISAAFDPEEGDPDPNKSGRPDPEGERLGYPWNPSEQSLDPPDQQSLDFYFQKKRSQRDADQEPYNPHTDSAPGNYNQGDSDSEAHYYDQSESELQGYYDPNAYPAQGYYEVPEQGYYDQQGQDIPNTHGHYDQQGYYNPNAYPAEGYYDALTGQRHEHGRVKEPFSDMLGENPAYDPGHEKQPFDWQAHQQAQPYSPELVSLPLGTHLPGPFADLFYKLRADWQGLKQKITEATDVFLDLEQTLQASLHETKESPVRATESLSSSAQEASQASVSFVDLHDMQIDFTDNYDQPLFDFSQYAHSQYKITKAIADPAAYETALWAIRECAPLAQDLPDAEYGPYANLPLAEVMNQVTDPDLQAFLRYVQAHPQHFVGHQMRISGAFAAWVVCGAHPD